MSGKVVHFEIPFDDGDRARGFYREAFDWDVQSLPEMGGYTLATTGPSGDRGPTEPGFINGGMLGRDIASSSTPVIVVEVDDIDAALEKIERLGGAKLVGRTAVADFGFAAYFKDTEGNVVGLWESAPHG